VRLSVGTDVVGNTPVVLLELGPGEVARLMEGESVRVPAAEALSAWRPVLDGQPWAADVAVRYTPDVDGAEVGCGGVRWFRPDASSRSIAAVVGSRAPESEVLASAEVEVAAGTRFSSVVPANVVEAFGAFWRAMQPVMARWTATAQEMAAVLEAAGFDPADLAGGVAEPAPWCGCLCPTHRGDGMFCEGEAVRWVTLTPNGWVPDPQPIAMCGMCAGWWGMMRPGRVVSVRRLDA
jgi:hypothetical protein